MPSSQPSPLQNRVSPFGEVVAARERGSFMGNRGGCFHGEDQTLTRARWTSRQWITCLLEFKNRRRKVMEPGLYTELFFLDEATALAAGHRPCFECRRADSLRFFDAIRAGVPGLVADGERLYVDAVDRRLHEERVDARSKAKRTTDARLGELSDGSMVAFPQAPRRAYLVMAGQLFAWSFAGYGPPIASTPETAVTVLTPPTTVAALRAGYAAMVHPSARL